MALPRDSRARGLTRSASGRNRRPAADDRSPGFASALRWRPARGSSASFLSVDKSVVRPIAHSRRGRWRLFTWHAVRTGVGASCCSRHSAPIPREPARMRGSVCRSAFQPCRVLAVLPPGDRLGSLAGSRKPSAFSLAIRLKADRCSPAVEDPVPSQWQDGRGHRTSLGLFPG